MRAAGDGRPADRRAPLGSYSICTLPATDTDVLLPDVRWDGTRERVKEREPSSAPSAALVPFFRQIESESTIGTTVLMGMDVK